MGSRRYNPAPESTLPHSLKESGVESPYGTENFAVQPNTSVASGLTDAAAADWQFASRPLSWTGLQ